MLKRLFSLILCFSFVLPMAGAVAEESEKQYQIEPRTETAYPTNGEGKRYTERKNIGGIDVPYTSALAIYNDTVIKETADKLFGKMNPVRELSSQAMELYKAGYYLEALGVMRNYFIDEIRKTPSEGMKSASFYTYLDKDYRYLEQYRYIYDIGSVVMGDMTIEEYTAENSDVGMVPLIDLGGVLKYPDGKQDSDIDWTYERGYGAPGIKGTDVFGMAAYPLESILAGRYLTTGDVRVIEKWSQFMNDMALNHRATFDKMLEGIPKNQVVKFNRSSKFSHNLYTNYITLTSADILYIGDRYTEHIAMLAALFKGLPDPERETDYGRALSDLIRTGMPVRTGLPDESYNLIDPVRFANILCYFAEDCFYKLTNCIYMNDPLYQNQVISIENACVIMYGVCKDFKYPQSCREDMVNKINSKMIGYLQPDGGYLEVAFNYNTTYDNPRLKRLGQVLDVLCPEIADRLTADLVKHTTYYDRIQEAYTSPIGLRTNIGNTYYHTTLPYWKDEKAMADLREANKKVEHAYKSVYFPYSGYGAMREGWDPEDLYLAFFNNGRRQQGHHITGTNAVMNLTAYGRTMLVSGGQPLYFQSVVDPNQRPFFYENFYEFNSYMYESSTAKLSTIMVNKKSQNKAESKFNSDGTYGDVNVNTDKDRLATVSGEVLDSRWHTSDNFDFAEGSWRFGYSNTDDQRPNPGIPGEPGAIELDAIHDRKFFFLKDADLWVLLDNLENGTGKKNTYQQIWNFATYTDEPYQNNQPMTGYKEEQVQIDNENMVAYSCDNEGPNLFIHSIGTKPIEYVKYYGYYKKGEMGFGWSNGPSTVGKEFDSNYTPRVDIHAEWQDDGIMGQNTRVITVLAPSRDTSDPVKSKEDISDKEREIVAAKFETVNGKTIYYYNSLKPQVIKHEGIETLCKDLIVIEDENTVRGLVLDCGFFIYNSINAGYSMSENFEFELTKDYNMDSSDKFYKPESFSWRELDNGLYEPEYK